MNPDSYGHQCYPKDKEHYWREYRAVLAGHLNKLREYAEDRDPAYRDALDDVAERMGLTRTERVTYSA